MEQTYGIISLVPVAVILVTALITKSTFQSILYGVIVGFLILGGGSPMVTFELFLDGLFATMMDENTVWVLLICALFGSLTALMERSGGVLGFSGWTQRIIKTRHASLIGTWVLGIIVFVDDYLNALAVGSAMRPITDKFKVSREMLVYIINSTGVTVCAIVPFSTWSAFMAGLMEQSGMTGDLSPTAAYMSAIPFMVYGWIAVIMVPLFALKIIPLYGPMKAAETRVQSSGQVLSNDSLAVLADTPEATEAAQNNKLRTVNFLLPMFLVAVVTVVTEDILIGLFAALILCLVMYLPQKLMSLNEYFDAFNKGMVDMFPVLVVIILAYVLQEANAGLGLTDYVIELTLGSLPPALLPVTIFIVISFLSFATGTFWGLAAVAFPIVAPLASALNVSPFLCAGALISAVAVGGHICLYSDTVILSCASTQVSNVDYFKTSFPLVCLPIFLSAIVFLILGFVI